MTTLKTTKNALSDQLSAKETVLTLFQQTGSLATSRSSNTVSFYDIMPKYARAGNEPIVVSDANQSTRTYDFNVDGQAFIVEVKAADIKNPDTNKIEYHFPATREELIEDVLRHLLTAARQMTFFDDHVGLQFTVYNISQELRKYNKLKHNGQIRLSLRVLRRARLSVFRASDYNNGIGDPIFEGPFFSDATVVDINKYYNRGSSDLEGQNIKGLVKFHNMISMGIAEMDFRLLRYDIIMSYRSEMARWLHKRISHRHRIKSQYVPYEIKLSTIFNDGNWKWLSRLDKTRAKFEAALDEMRALGQLNAELHTEFEDVIDNKTGKKIDYKLKIYLSQQFLDHIANVDDIHANFKRKMEPESPASDLLPSDDPQRPAFLMLMANGVFETEAASLALKYSNKEVERAISYAISHQRRKQKAEPNRHFNLGAFIKKTLEEGWHKPKPKTKQSTTEEQSSFINANENDDSPTTTILVDEPSPTQSLIDPNQYTGIMRDFVEQVVLTLPLSAQSRFLIFGVKNKEFAQYWEAYLHSCQNILDED